MSENIKLTDEERKIIEIYRSTSEQGKKYLSEQAEITGKIFKPETIIFPTWKTENTNGGNIAPHGRK